MPKEKISYFISILNSNIFTVKNKSKLESNNSTTYNRKYQSLTNNLTMGGIGLYENKVKLITLSLKFLSFSDYMPLMLTSKKFNEKISRRLYKKILLDNPNLTNSTRFEVWKSILGYVNILYTDYYITLFFKLG